MDGSSMTTSTHSSFCVLSPVSIPAGDRPTIDNFSRCETGTAMKVFAAPAPALPGFRPNVPLPGAGPASAGLVPRTARPHQREIPRGAQPLPGCRTRLASLPLCRSRCDVRINQNPVPIHGVAYR